MKRLWLVTCLFVSCLSFAQASVKDGQLAVILRSVKTSYRLTDTVHLEILLSNVGSSPLLIRRELGWGVGRTDVHVYDASGKEVFTSFLADELPPPFKEGDFIELGTNQLFGQRVDEPAAHFVIKPGTYTLVVSYTQPFSEKFVRENLKVPDVPMWGRERGTIGSNRITLTFTK